MSCSFRIFNHSNRKEIRQGVVKEKELKRRESPWKGVVNLAGTVVQGTRLDELVLIGPSSGAMVEEDQGRVSREKGGGGGERERKELGISAPFLFFT